MFTVVKIEMYEDVALKSFTTLEEAEKYLFQFLEPADYEDYYIRVDKP